MARNVIFACDAADCSAETRGFLLIGWYVVKQRHDPPDVIGTREREWHFCSDACLIASMGQSETLLRVVGS